MVEEGQDGGSPPEPTRGDDDAGELRLGTTARGAAANGVILAVTRAARSFLLYDPANEAIRVFLENLRGTAEGFLREHGDLPIQVHPFELLLDGEVVYLDRDRERSLAFRLFRDGVRGLSLQVGLTWEELLKLLEVLSIRYAGVRQSEDDMVVLLWKAGFQHIQVEAVEGFAPEEEVGEEVRTVGDGAHVEVPDDFDLPAPNLQTLGPMRWSNVSEDTRRALREEDATAALPELCAKLVDSLLERVSDPTDLTSFTEILPLLREIRDFLLAEGLLTVVTRVVTQLATQALPDATSRRERDALLHSFADEGALGRMVHSVSRDRKFAPPEMVALLEALPGDHLDTLIRILEREHVEAPRRVARSLLERYVPTRGAYIVEKLVNSDTKLACELLRMLAYADVNRALEAADEIKGRTELDLQLEALRVLEKAPANPTVGRLLVNYAAATNEEVRLRAYGLLGRRGVRTAFSALLDRVKRDVPMRLGTREAEAAGEALVHMDPERALLTFREWLKPKGLFGSVIPGSAMLQWTAVAGLVHVQGSDAETLIKSASERGGSELATFCTASMVKRRRLQRGVV